jgi:hypothetical protein
MTLRSSRSSWGIEVVKGFTWIDGLLGSLEYGSDIVE